MDNADLLVHPVRMRIVHAMSGGRSLTTAQLCGRLPDVSKATVYRHVALLAEGGVLEVDGEHRVRGAVERTYRLRRERVVIDAERAASVDKSEHRRIFALAMTILTAEYNAYLDDEATDPVLDEVGYRQHALWLTPSERTALIADLRAAIVPRMSNEPAAGREQYLLSPIMFPTAQGE